MTNKANIRISWPALVVLEATSSHRLHSGMFSCRYFFLCAPCSHSYSHAVYKLSVSGFLNRGGFLNRYIKKISSNPFLRYSRDVLMAAYSLQ